MVLATIEDQGPFRLLLDTGAAVSLLDDDVASRLGSRVSPSSMNMRGGGGRTVAASGQVRIGRLVSGGITLQDFDMVIHDLARFDPILGPLDGVLGYSAFRGTTFTIDYPGRTVTATNERLDSDAPRQDDEAWFEFGTSRPHIVADVADERIVMLADSGSGAGFDLEAFEALPRTGSDRVSHASLNLDQLVVSRAARLNGELRMGPITYATPTITSDPSGSKIGTLVMSKFRWTFDTRAGLVRVDGGPMLVEPEPLINLGFVGSVEPGAIVVAHVAEESDTYANGLRKGDRVLEVNGVAVESCICGGMREARDRATPAVLSVERDGERKLIEAPPYTVVP
ncbi:MAG: aspartyl protease family protein [Phycisphaerae bacterium]